MHNNLYQLSPALFLGVTCATAGILCFSLSYLGAEARKISAPLLVSLLVIFFLFSTWQGNTEVRERMASEPQDYQYLYDGSVYLKAFYLMKDQTFYTAYINAFDKISGGQERMIILNGKFNGEFVTNPTHWREPYLFYFWKFFTGDNGIGIYYMTVGLSSFFLILSFFAGRQLLGNNAVFLTAILTPYLITTNLSFNLMMLDHWAAIFLTSGIFFWILRKYGIAAIFFLLAALSREVLFPFLILFFAFSYMKYKKSMPAFATCMSIFLVGYIIHFIQADKLISKKIGLSSALFPQISITRFLETSSYHLLTYGVIFIPAVIYLILALALWIKLRNHALTALTLLIFPYFLVASSPYWGEHFMYFILFSAFLFPLSFIGKNAAGEGTPGRSTKG